MLFLESKEKEDAKYEQFRLAMLSGAPQYANKFFPEYFPEQVEEAVSEEEIDNALNQSSGTTRFQEMDSADAEEIIKMLGASVKMSLDDLSEVDENG